MNKVESQNAYLGKKCPKLSNNNICLEGISYLYPRCTIKNETVLYLGGLFHKWYKQNNNIRCIVSDSI